jgi:hypothetical protein
MHREHDDLALDIRGSETRERVETAEPWHGQVRDDDIWPKSCGGIEQLLPIANRADDVEIGLFQDPREAIGDNRVVVG